MNKLLTGIFISALAVSGLAQAQTSGSSGETKSRGASTTAESRIEKNNSTDTKNSRETRKAGSNLAGDESGINATTSPGSKAAGGTDAGPRGSKSKTTKSDEHGHGVK